MTSDPAPLRSNRRIWTGRILSALPVLFLLMDGAVKIASPAKVAPAFEHLQLPLSLAPAIALLEILCALLYAVPRTAVLGALLLTGFLGGAVSTHVRVGDPLFSHILFPVYIGAFVWLGIFLREDRLRALMPLRAQAGAAA